MEAASNVQTNCSLASEAQPEELMFRFSVEPRGTPNPEPPLGVP